MQAMQGMDMTHEVTGDLPCHLYFGASCVFLAFLSTRALLQRGGVVVTRPLDPKADGSLAILAASTGRIETWFKILGPLIGIAGELRYVDFPPSDMSLMFYQHITAYASFTVAGVTDL